MILQPVSSGCPPYSAFPGAFGSLSSDAQSKTGTPSDSAAAGSAAFSSVRMPSRTSSKSKGGALSRMTSQPASCKLTVICRSQFSIADAAFGFPTPYCPLTMSFVPNATSTRSACFARASQSPFSAQSLALA